MALIPFSNPNISRIIDSDYEAYTDRLLDEMYADRGERCKNCKHFVEAYKDDPAYCNKDGIEELEEDEFQEKLEDYVVRPEDCCEDYECDCFYDDREDDW